MEFAENSGDSDQPYKYNGKELDKMHGLNMYDYSARYMEPAIGRFTTMDLLAEIYYHLSPYVYCANNPLKFIDPDGRKIKIANNAVGAMENIAKIAATTQGARVVNQLINSFNVYTLTSTKFFWSSKYNDETMDIRYVGDPWVKKVDSGSLSSMIAMGHEMQHAYDHSIGVFNNAQQLIELPELHIKVESRAVSFANNLREVYELFPLRENYSGLGTKSGDLIYHQMPAAGERIYSFTTLGSNKSKTSTGYTYSKAYSYYVKLGNTKIKVSGSQQYYMVVSRDKDNNATYQVYKDEDEYKRATEDW